VRRLVFGILVSLIGLVVWVLVVYWIWLIQDRLGRVARDLGEIKEILSRGASETGGVSSRPGAEDTEAGRGR